MRFERRLLAQRREDPEWVGTYIDYSSLKLSVYAAASGQCVDFHALLREQASAASSFFQRKWFAPPASSSPSGRSDLPLPSASKCPSRSFPLDFHLLLDGFVALSSIAIVLSRWSAASEKERFGTASFFTSL
jgi:hypothetical protein